LGATPVIWIRRAPTHAPGIEFLGMTNVPGVGPRALLKVTNLTPDLIICTDGYLGPGESATGLYTIPAGAGRFRLAVHWQRRDLNKFEVRMNTLRARTAEAFGSPQYHRDPWLPLSRIAYSPEIQR
jgi:hypothetical protein